MAPLAADRVRADQHVASITTPPPVPVPMITPKTTRAPAAAPSVASDNAKQLASFANRIGRPTPAADPRSGVPFSQVELEFLISPVAGEIVPGNADADAPLLA